MTSKRCLALARSWALDHVSHTPSYDTMHIKLHIDVSQITEDDLVMLMEVPMWFCLSKIKPWWSIHDKQDVIVFDNGGSHLNKLELDIKLFEDNQKGVYIGLYTKNGERWCEECLVVWDKTNCGVFNVGYAGGRCPPTL